jgi:3-hydroxyisobutyrate dehydrogenase-like beta-hydroxyacid dehydrogenase
MAPVFGAPPVADAGQLLVVMAGDYRSKKEVAHLLVPGVGRKVIDLGGNLEKGRFLSTLWKHSVMILISV